MPTKRKMYPVQLYDADLHKAMKAKAKEEKRSLTFVVEAACRQYLRIEREVEQRTAEKRLVMCQDGVARPTFIPPPLPPSPRVIAASGQSCVRCGHPRQSHWLRGCLAGCMCSEARFRRT